MAEKTRSDLWQWLALVLLLATVAGWNLVRSHRLQGQVAHARTLAAEAQGSSRSRVDKLLDAKAYGAVQFGRQLAWPADLEPLVGDGEETTWNGLGLVLFFSELSCNTCLDAETQFVNSVAEATGGDGVRIVAHASNPRYARNYARFNGVVAPLFFDRGNAFGDANRVEETPMLFLHDEQGKVLAAHFPVPDEPDWSAPFHDLVLRAFGLI